MVTEHRVALITGGFALALADIDTPGLERAVAELGPDVAYASPTDVRSFDACAAAVSAAVDTFGRLDVLVNCAGVWVEGPTDTMTEADWDRVVDVNLKGTFGMCRSAIPALEATRGSSSTSRRTRACGAPRAPRSTARARAA